MVVAPTPGPKPTPKDIAPRPTITIDELDRVMEQLITELNRATSDPGRTTTGPTGEHSNNSDKNNHDEAEQHLAQSIADRTHILQRAHEQLSAALSGTPAPTPTRSATND